MEGIVLINKPAGCTSHDIVMKARGALKIKKIGHAGTLDPLATGLLILLVGKGTKLFDQFVGMDKAYRATLILGQETTTADIEGETVKEGPYQEITNEQIETAFSVYEGKFEQLPPMVSAVRHKGKKLYEWARKGVTVERTPRAVRIDKLVIEEINKPNVSFYMECSKGTYVRQLAEDIGKDLGCGACISKIERTKIGEFSLEDSVTIEELNESHIRHWEIQKTT